MAEYNEYKAQVDDGTVAKYEAEMVKVLAQLKILDRMFVSCEPSGENVSSTAGDSFEEVLNSGSVTVILENSDLIHAVTDSHETVELAIGTTKRLRIMVKEYHSLTGWEAQYAFYMQNKEEMTIRLRDLYTSMVSLGNEEDVYELIIDEGAEDEYLQFIASLYVQWALMDDDEALDSSLVYHGVPLTELVEKELIYEDKGETTPLEAYPSPIVAVPYPGEAPEKVDTLPTEPELPEPDEVDAPIRPTEVLQPVEVSDPGSEPSEPEMTAEEKALEEIAETLTSRTEEDLISTFFSVTMEVCTSTLRERYIRVNIMNRQGNLSSSGTWLFGTKLTADIDSKASSGGTNRHMVFVGWSLAPVPLPTEIGDVPEGIPWVTDIVYEMTIYPVFVMQQTVAEKDNGQKYPEE